jgi:hypothetical protein
MKTKSITWNFPAMNFTICFKRIMIILIFSLVIFPSQMAQEPTFRVIAFFTAKNDQAHISFVREANRWFQKIARDNGFVYDSTSNWNNMNSGFLSEYQTVIFLDTRPENPYQRSAFEQYMKNGGAWMGFHFAGFALTPSDYPQNWDWYHNQFLGCGEYKGNTWRPTSAVLRVEATEHPVAKGLPATFISASNEWYSWQNDVRKNQDIRVLLSIDSSSFPLGTGPKEHEIWHSGDYPVVWTNVKYRMIYINMGHNDIDYEHNTNKELSFTFENPVQNQLILNSLNWLLK